MPFQARIEARFSFFAIIDWLDAPLWYKALRDYEFTVMSHPFIMCSKSAQLQRTRGATFPQQASSLAIVALAPGRRVDGFSADLSSLYSSIDCSHKRKFALVDGVEPPPQPLRKKGTKSPLVKDEKNVKLLCEILTTFVPLKGSVFDPFGHAMTTPCAALLSGRPCTALQNDTEVFEAGLWRLSSILDAGKVTKSFRSKTQADRVRTRNMFEMYEETRTRSSRSSGSDEFACDDDFPEISPVTPRTVSSSSKCHVDGCLVTGSNNENEVPQQMYGHSCDLCGANVHIICCQRILKIEVTDSDTALF